MKSGQNFAIMQILKASGLHYTTADDSQVVRNVEGTSTLSMHAYKNAVDITGTRSEMDAIARMFARYVPNLEELIYTPLGYFFDKGEPFSPSATTSRNHVGHVHVAVTDADPLLKQAGMKADGSMIPPKEDKGVIGDAVDAAKAAGNAIAWLSNGHNWMRIGMVLAGGIMLLMALVKMGVSVPAQLNPTTARVVKAPHPADSVPVSYK